MKILVVDDEPVIVEVISEILESSHDVEKCCKIFEALEKLKNNVYDVVITDFNMPEMNGIDFSILIKKQQPECKVIMITGSELYDIENTLTIDNIIQKPINWNILTNILKK